MNNKLIKALLKKGEISLATKILGIGEENLVPVATGKLARQIEIWNKTKLGYEELSSKVKTMSKELGLLEKSILPQVSKLDKQMAKVNEIVVALKKKDSIPKPYKKFYENLLMKVNDRTRKETMKAFEEAVKEGTKEKEFLVKIESANILKLLKNMYNKVINTLKNVISKNNKDIDEMKKALKNI